MTSTSPASASPTADRGQTLRLSNLLKRPVVDSGGESLGRLSDVIVRLRGSDCPLVTGLVVAIGGRQVFVPTERASSFDGEVLKLTTAKLDLRQFERRDGEVLLRADVLGHRMIDVQNARLVRAADLQLYRDDGEWVLSGVDTRPRARRLFGLLGPGRPADEGGSGFRDWHDFEWLIGHTGSELLRGPFARVRRLNPAQIADLPEEASKNEETEILDRVHADPELEADVFEELDEDLATRLLGARTDEEIAGVLSRMRADDAADTIAELPQQRRQPDGGRLRGAAGQDDGSRRAGADPHVYHAPAGGADQRVRRGLRGRAAGCRPSGHAPAIRSGPDPDRRVRHRPGPGRRGHRHHGRRCADDRLQPDHDPRGGRRAPPARGHHGRRRARGYAARRLAPARGGGAAGRQARRPSVTTRDGPVQPRRPVQQAGSASAAGPA